MPEKGYDARTYWDTRLDRDFSLRGVGVRNLSRQYNTWLYRVRDRVFRRTVAGLGVDLKGAKVLDIGAGVGFYVERWKRLGAQVTAIDIADSAVRQLRPRHPDVRFERLDVSDDVSVLGDGYDVVSAFDVLFHIVDDERYARALQNVHDLLRPGGWFVFTDTMSSRRTQTISHYVRRSAAEISAALRAAGFELVTQRPAFVLMTYPFDLTDKEWRDRWSRYVGARVTTPLGGTLLGAALFLPELALTRVLRDGPASELVVCRRPSVLPSGAGTSDAPA